MGLDRGFIIRIMVGIFLLSCIVSAVSAQSISVSDTYCNQYEIKTVELRLNAPNGLAGLNMNICPANASVARIYSAIILGWAPLQYKSSTPASSVSVIGVDLNDAISIDATNVLIISLDIEALNPGTTSLIVDIVQMDDDLGGNMSGSVISGGTISVGNPGDPLPPPNPVYFVGEPLFGEAPLGVQFTDLSTNDPTGWLWEYKSGDDWYQFSASQHYLQHFVDPGVYSIRLSTANATTEPYFTAGSYTRENYVTVLESYSAYAIRPYDDRGANYVLPIWAFIILLIFTGVLALFTIVLSGHDYYADIISGVVATILGWYLSLSLIIGEFGNEVRDVSYSYIDNVTEEIVYEYGIYVEPMVNLPLAYLIGGFATVLGIYTFYLIVRIGMDMMDDVDY